MKNNIMISMEDMLTDSFSGDEPPSQLFPGQCWLVLNMDNPNKNAFIIMSIQLPNVYGILFDKAQLGSTGRYPEFEFKNLDFSDLVRKEISYPYGTTSNMLSCVDELLYNFVGGERTIAI